MREILGKAKTVRELLKGVKYSIDYYQREYKWHEKQVHELVDDLSDKFLEEYDPTHPRQKVADYPHYFLGSIIISKKESVGYIVDGQQRLTSLTLLLVLLRNLQKGHAERVNVDELIFSEKYGQKSFNLHVDERTPAMDALYEGQPFDVTDRPESVQNLVQRYRDLEEAFPDDLRDDALPYFIDWLLENVHLVEITAYSDDDAYTIFETMNDRGLSLSPTDMLKGYLLANISENKRTSANTRWRERIRELNDAGKEVEPDCFKAWLRSANTPPKSANAGKVRSRRTSTGSEQSFTDGCAMRPTPSVLSKATTSTASSTAISTSTAGNTYALSKPRRSPLLAWSVSSLTPSTVSLSNICSCSRRCGRTRARRWSIRNCAWSPVTSTSSSRGACGISAPSPIPQCSIRWRRLFSASGGCPSKRSPRSCMKALSMRARRGGRSPLTTAYAFTNRTATPFIASLPV